MNLERYVVYDVEVLRDPATVDGAWDNPEALGFASAVVYSYETNRYHFFLHLKQRKDLLRFLTGKIAVSFNGIKFDSRVLLGNNRELDADGCTRTDGRTGKDILWWDNYDILLEYIKATFGFETVAEAEEKLGDKAIHDGTFSLDGLGEGTLGMRKSGHGAAAPYLYDAGRWLELLAYNLQDVRITKHLFDFVLAHGFVFDRLGRAVKLETIPQSSHAVFAEQRCVCPICGQPHPYRSSGGSGCGTGTDQPLV